MIKYIISILLIAFLGYNSVYFKRLDEVKSASTKTFDAASYSRKFYDQLLQRADSAVALTTLVALLKTEPKRAFDRYSNALAIGNLRYFLVRGEGKVISTEPFVIELSDQAKVGVATEFVYGNSVRDASGLVSLNDFTTVELNSLSEEVNKIIRVDLLPAFISKAKAGSVIRFAGAIELNQKFIDIDAIEIVPIQLTIQ